MNEYFSMDDSFVNRVFTLPVGTEAPNRTIIVRVVSTLPLLISNDNVIVESTIKELKETKAVGDTNKLVDTKWTAANQNADRMVLMGAAKSIISGNRAFIYYDKKWQDILILPHIETLALSGDNITFPIDGFRVGSGVPMREQNAFLTISMDEADRFKLPEGKAGLPNLKTRYISVPYSGTNGSNPTSKLTTYIGADYSYEETSSSMQTFIELGSKDEVFNGAGSLPIYLFYQTSLMDSGIRYLGTKDTKGQKLYLRVPF